MSFQKPRKILNNNGLTTFLADYGADFCEDLTQNVDYSELVLLNEHDLELMGHIDQKKRKNLLEYISHLPNQVETWEHIIKENKDAEMYNDTILSNASARCLQLSRLLSNDNLKLSHESPEDVVIENNKHFASKFLVEALDGLLDSTKELEKNIDDLEKVMTESTIEKSDNTKWLLILSLSVIPVSIAAYMWYKKYA